MKKNIFLLFLALCSFSAIHAEITSTLSDDGTLTISGTGEIPERFSEQEKVTEKITNVIIKDGVTSIGGYAFIDCKALTSITIPNSVTSIGGLAFSNCTALTSITIPNSVTSIGSFAFLGCAALTSITFEGSTPPEFGWSPFEGVDKSIPVYVPFGSQKAYLGVFWGGWSFSSWRPSNVKQYLADNEPYTQDSQVDGTDVTYIRNFTNKNWQAIYLPFSLNYEDLKDDFELAYINAVRQYDDNHDDVIDKTVLEVVKIKSGSTVPNAPYLIKAKKTGKKTISVKNATVSAAEERSVDCSTTIAKFTITGNYSTVPYETLSENNYYAMGGGELIHSNGSDLKPFRWYMKVESRNYSKYNVNNAAKAITIKVLDEEETTGVEELRVANDELPVYDINGRKVNENSLKPGMYIKNGRKFVVK